MRRSGSGSRRSRARPSRRSRGSSRRSTRGRAPSSCRCSRSRTPGCSSARTPLREALTSPVALGVLLGLVVGKVVGITLASLVAVRTRHRPAPRGRRPARRSSGTAAVAGIGFTVSLFVAELAFSDPGVADTAKVGHLRGVAGRRGTRVRRAPLGPSGSARPSLFAQVGAPGSSLYCQPSRRRRRVQQTSLLPLHDDRGGSVVRCPRAGRWPDQGRLRQLRDQRAVGDPGDLAARAGLRLLPGT